MSNSCCLKCWFFILLKSESFNFPIFACLTLHQLPRKVRWWYIMAFSSFMEAIKILLISSQQFKWKEPRWLVKNMLVIKFITGISWHCHSFACYFHVIRLFASQNYIRNKKSNDCRAFTQRLVIFRWKTENFSEVRFFRKFIKFFRENIWSIISWILVCKGTLM